MFENYRSYYVGDWGCFIFIALNNPQASFPWSNAVTYIFYGIYVVMMIVLFIAPFKRKSNFKFIRPFASLLEPNAAELSVPDLPFPCLPFLFITIAIYIVYDS